MLNETLRVSGLTGSPARPDLQEGQRTDLSAQFDEGPPAGGREMDKGNPGRAQDDEATANDEADKQEVKDED